MTDTPNTTQGKGAVDWTKPIEAAHGDGRVVAGQADQTDEGFCEFSAKLGGVKRLFAQDGRGCKGAHGWRIRNVPEHPAPMQYAPELVERMLAFANRCHQLSLGRSCFVGGADGDEEKSLMREVASIVSDLPQEVDPDEAYAEQLIKEMGWAGEAEIGEVAVRRLVAKAYAAGRQLERGDAA